MLILIFKWTTVAHRKVNLSKFNPVLIINQDEVENNSWCRVRTGEEFCLCIVTWRCVSIHGGLNHQWTSFGRHGHCHLPLYMSCQDGLHCLRVDIWEAETESYIHTKTERMFHVCNEMHLSFVLLWLFVDDKFNSLLIYTLHFMRKEKN